MGGGRNDSVNWRSWDDTDLNAVRRSATLEDSSVLMTSRRSDEEKKSWDGGVLPKSLRWCKEKLARKGPVLSPTLDKVRDLSPVETNTCCCKNNVEQLHRLRWDFEVFHTFQIGGSKNLQINGVPVVEPKKLKGLKSRYSSNYLTSRQSWDARTPYGEFLREIFSQTRAAEEKFGAPPKY